MKIAYGVFGLMLSIIIASGLRIYFLRRRQKGLNAPRLAASWEAVIWGTPALLSLTLLISLVIGLGGIGLVILFWVGLIAVVSCAARYGYAIKTSKLLKVMTAGLIFLSLCSHSLLSTQSILNAASIPVSISLIMTSIALLLMSIKKRSI